MRREGEEEGDILRTLERLIVIPEGMDRLWMMQY
jgi:hypothetical protein